MPTLTKVDPSTWNRLPPFEGTINGDEQVLLIAATGGAKSTLAASMTLGVASLVAIDEKAALKLPRSRTIELPQYRDGEGKPSAEFTHALGVGLRWRDDRRGTEYNRVIVRPHVLDIDDFDAHDAIFRAVYQRRHTIVWIDEITATGATAQRVQPWLRAITARGRTRGLGLWTCSQAPFGITPPILRRNAHYLILGPLDPDDTKDINRPGVAITTELPRNRGRFILYHAGERDPYRLYIPIPEALRGWSPP